MKIIILEILLPLAPPGRAERASREQIEEAATKKERAPPAALVALSGGGLSGGTTGTIALNSPGCSPPNRDYCPQ